MLLNYSEMLRVGCTYDRRVPYVVCSKLCQLCIMMNRHALYRVWVIAVPLMHHSLAVTDQYQQDLRKEDGSVAKGHVEVQLFLLTWLLCSFGASLSISICRENWVVKVRVGWIHRGRWVSLSISYTNRFILTSSYDWKSIMSQDSRDSGARLR